MSGAEVQDKLSRALRLYIQADNDDKPSGIEDRTRHREERRPRNTSYGPPHIHRPPPARR